MSQRAEAGRGFIHDIGYRRYHGPRLGRTNAIFALYGHSLRAVFGLGRPARSRMLPFVLFGITCMPAVVSAAITALTPLPAAIPYAHYPYYLQVVIIVFLASQAPQLVSGDLRFHLLPLYFSRPLERGDYVWAKLAALATGMLILLATPLLIIYLAVLLAHTHSPQDALQETGRLLGGLGGALVHAVFLAALGLVISAFNRVRAFAAVAVVGIYLVSGSAAAIAEGISHSPLPGLFTPFTLLDGFQSWAFAVQPAGPFVSAPLGPLYAAVALAVPACSVALLLWRYRRAEM